MDTNAQASLKMFLTGWSESSCWWGRWLPLLAYQIAGMELRIPCLSSSCLRGSSKSCKINRKCAKSIATAEEGFNLKRKMLQSLETLFMRSKEFSRVRTLSGWSICWTGGGASPMTLLNVACGLLKRRRFLRRGLSPPRTVADSPSPSKLSGRDVANTTSKCSRLNATD